MLFTRLVQFSFLAIGLYSFSAFAERMGKEPPWTQDKPSAPTALQDVTEEEFAKALGIDLNNPEAMKNLPKGLAKTPAKPAAPPAPPPTKPEPPKVVEAPPPPPPKPEPPKVVEAPPPPPPAPPAMPAAQPGSLRTENLSVQAGAVRIDGGIVSLGNSRVIAGNVDLINPPVEQAPWEEERTKRSLSGFPDQNPERNLANSGVLNVLPGVPDVAIILNQDQFFPARIRIPPGAQTRLLFTTTNTRPAALVIERLDVQRWVGMESRNKFPTEVDRAVWEINREISATRITEVVFSPSSGTYSFHDALSGASGEIIVE